MGGRFRILLAALCAVGLMGCAVRASAQDEGVIVQSSCSIVQSGDYVLVYSYAQVHNQSEQIICLDQGTYALLNGDALLAENDVTQMWPYFLGPGEDGYFFDILPFEPNENGVQYPSITGVQYHVEYMTVQPQYAGYALGCQANITRESQDSGVYIVCELSNPTQMIAYSPTVYFALYTEGGVLLYADGMTLQNVGIPAGGTMFVRFHVDDAFVNQWDSYGASPTQVRAGALFRQDSD